jgi:magnesium transporter
MKTTMTRDGVVTHDVPVDEIGIACTAGSFFWLDIDSSDGAEDQAAVTDLLLHHFEFHPLAVEDAEHFGQRPKIDDYDGFTYLVAHGARPPGQIGTAEVHMFISEKFVVTVHRGDCPVLAEVGTRMSRHRASQLAAPQVVLAYLIIDGLTDTFFPALSSLDDSIDALEDQILQKPTEEQLGRIFDMKRQLVAIRKVITPQRDMLAGVTAGVIDIPGMNDEGARYFRDLYDHLIRISDMVDNYRDLLSGVMDTHVSTVSNRLNVVMKQLTIIATVFLPLTFLTGFFGQNFAWLVRNISGFWVFMIFGIGTEVAAILALLYLFKRRGWLGGPSA